MNRLLSSLTKGLFIYPLRLSRIMQILMILRIGLKSAEIGGKIMSNPNLPISGKYNTYIGARYVPLMGGEWNQDKAYEPLVIVTYQGNSYTSNTFVPAGTDINDKTYWTLTGNYNGQVEQYRSEVQGVKQDVNQLNESLDELQNTVNANEVDIEGKVAGIQDNLSHITPISYGTPDFNTVDIMIFGRGFINYSGINLPVSNIPISMTGTMTSVPFHKNVVFVLDYGDEAHIHEYLTFIINQEPKLQYAKFFLILKPPTSFNEFKSYISSHRTLLNQSNATRKYIYNMYPVCSQWKYYANSMGVIIRLMVGAAIYGNDIPMSMIRIVDTFDTEHLSNFTVNQIITPFQTFQIMSHAGGSFSSFTPNNLMYTEQVTSHMNFFHGTFTQCRYLCSFNDSSKDYIDTIKFAPVSDSQVHFKVQTLNNQTTTGTGILAAIPNTTPIIEQNSNRDSDLWCSDIICL